MKQDVEQLIEKVECGELSLADFADVDPIDIETLRHIARVAFETGRFDKALRIFMGLEALEPERIEHILCRAHSEAAAGRTANALISLTRYFRAEARHPRADLVDALLLRAELVIATNRDAAVRDLRLAKAIAQQSPEAHAILERVKL